MTVTTTGLAAPITYVFGEFQVVSGAPRANFDLAQGHTANIFGVNVFHNGVRLAPDAQYGRSGFTVFLVVPAQVGDVVLFDYLYQ